MRECYSEKWGKRGEEEWFEKWGEDYEETGTRWAFKRYSDSAHEREESWKHELGANEEEINHETCRWSKFY